MLRRVFHRFAARTALALRFLLGRFHKTAFITTGKIDHIIRFPPTRAIATVGVAIIVVGRCGFGLLPLILIFVLISALTVFILLLLLLRLPLGLFTLRFGQHAKVMLGMLLEVLSRDAVTSKLSIPRKLIVLVDDLLRRTAYLAFGTGAIEHTVDDIADRPVAVVLVPRT